MSIHSFPESSSYLVRTKCRNPYCIPVCLLSLFSTALTTLPIQRQAKFSTVLASPYPPSSVKDKHIVLLLLLHRNPSRLGKPVPPKARGETGSTYYHSVGYTYETIKMSRTLDPSNRMDRRASTLMRGSATRMPA